MLPEEAPVRLTNAQLEELDYRKLYAAYSSRGRKSVTDPRVLFKIMVYGYQCGIYTTRKLEEACRYRIDFKWLLWDEPVPDHSTISRFWICVVLDLYSRMVISYGVSRRNSTQLVRRTFQDAFNHRSPTLPLTIHTDRGSNYRSDTFRNLLQQLGVTQSFSKASTPYDNSVVESFFSSLKREELYRKKYRSEKEFRTELADYMDFYNADRPHAHNKYRTPAQAESDYYSEHAD